MSIYCSKKCSGKDKTYMPDLVCEKCGKTFHLRQESRTGKFCSAECAGTPRNGKVIQKCEVCGKEREVYASKGNRKFCGYKCAYIGRKHFVSFEARERMSENQKGKKGNGWNGGITIESVMFYTSGKWKRLSKLCKDRDNCACQRCFNYFPYEKLRAHHIFFRADGGEDVLENLITLCNPCHKKTHWEAKKQSV